MPHTDITPPPPQRSPPTSLPPSPGTDPSAPGPGPPSLRPSPSLPAPPAPPRPLFPFENPAFSPKSRLYHRSFSANYCAGSNLQNAPTRGEPGEDRGPQGAASVLQVSRGAHWPTGGFPRPPHRGPPLRTGGSGAGSSRDARSPVGGADRQGNPAHLCNPRAQRGSSAALPHASPVWELPPGRTWVRTRQKHLLRTFAVPLSGFPASVESALGFWEAVGSWPHAKNSDFTTCVMDTVFKSPGYKHEFSGVPIWVPRAGSGRAGFPSNTGQVPKTPLWLDPLPT